MKLSTLSLRAASAAALLSVVVTPAHAITLTFNSTNGDFLTATNWSGTPQGVPGSGDVGIIRAVNGTTSRTATIAGAANVGTLIVGDNVADGVGAGNLVINSGANLTVGSAGFQIARNSAGSSTVNNHKGFVTMNGGTVTASGLYVGANITGTNGGSGGFTINDGTISVTGSSNMKIGGETSSRTGVFTINGDSASISGGTGTLSLSQWGTVNFNFDTTGVSRISFGTINLASAGTAGSININGASYTGGTAAFTLFDATTSLTNYSLSAFSIAGFDSLNYTTGLAFDIPTQSVILTVTATAVPEPSTYAALAGMLALAFTASRRRRQA